jgi:hypothetical protein
MRSLTKSTPQEVLDMQVRICTYLLMYCAHSYIQSVTVEKGLTTQEANSRRQIFGENVLEAEEEVCALFNIIVIIIFLLKGNVILEICNTI